MSKTVLLLDDEPDVVGTLERYLLADGFAVSAFVNPYSAIEHFKSKIHDFDAIVSDIRMPKMDGFAFAREIRKISSPVKIILMTAFELTATADELKSCGVSELLMKPFTGSELASLIVHRKLSKDNEVLDKVYVCKKCSATFIFNSDVQDHKAFARHDEFANFPLA